MDRTMFCPYKYIPVSEKPGYRLIAIFKRNPHAAGAAQLRMKMGMDSR